jgi:hypothetical protein
MLQDLGPVKTPRRPHEPFGHEPRLVSSIRRSPRHLAVQQVERQFTHLQQAARLPGRPSPQGLHAGREFLDIERFGQVIVGSEVQPSTVRSIRSERSEAGPAVEPRSRIFRRMLNHRGLQHYVNTSTS